MVVNENACLPVKRGALEFIASELAPTGFTPFAMLKFRTARRLPGRRSPEECGYLVMIFQQ
jgi:hypothetical protein